MYVRKIVIEQVVNLFTDEPEYRDDRYGTIEYICQNHYATVYGKSIKSDYKMLSDIDRAFRLIQQDIPSLRGEKWRKRQIRGGRKRYLNDEEDELFREDLKTVTNQLKLFSENDESN